MNQDMLPDTLSGPKPNFLIVGSHKAGTTNLFSILANHPAIAHSKIKEPRFLVSDVLASTIGGPGDMQQLEHTTCMSASAYSDQFADAGDRPVRMEGSVCYLYYSSVAVPRIKKHIGDPAILILLREPVARSFSGYKYLLSFGRETLSFEAALEAEEERRRNGYSYMWHYAAGSYYAENTQTYIQAFSRVKVVFFDDFVSDPESTVRDVLRFLDVDTNVALPKTAVRNPSGVPRSQMVDWFLRGRHKWRRRLGFFLPRSFKHYVKSVLTYKTMRQIALKEETAVRLRGAFVDETRLLESVVGRPLPWSFRK